jgi:3-hydroxyisobutyrate dehydrogenase-like beta-hydroxyacid dehydrogenase
LLVTVTLTNVYLQAPVSGSKKPAIDGQLIILAAGDRTLFDEALPAFEKMGKRWVGAPPAACLHDLVCMIYQM